MINLIIYTFKRFAWFKRLNAKVTYELLAKNIPEAEWQFMNYGYMPETGEKPLDRPLDPQVQRFPLQMYHHLATKVEIAGKDILEVGSGRGGGARHVAEWLKPASYVGMDIAQSAVDLANKNHALPNLKFIQGSAESIPLPDGSVDVVLNVESCHGYGSVPKFLAEVKRVLKPGGYLLLVDFRNVKNTEIFKEQLRDTRMEIVEEKDISENVIQAIEAEDETKQARIKTWVPQRWQKLFSDFAGVVGSRIHTNLKNQSRLYYRFVVRKPASA